MEKRMSVMYKNEKILKITSILLIIYGVFDILQLFIVLIITAISSNKMLLIVQSILIMVTAILNLVTGIMGINILNRSGKEKIFNISGYMLLVFILLEIFFAIVMSSFQIKLVTQGVVHIIIVCCCIQNAAKVIIGQSIFDIRQD